MSGEIASAIGDALSLIHRLEVAFAEANRIQRLEGRTHADKALSMFLGERLATARKLAADLLSISEG